MRFAYAVLAVSLSACSLYGGSQPPPCKQVLDTPPSEELRDPSTGVCQFIGGGGGCPVDSCGPCEGAGALIPNWPACNGPCEGLAEADCVAAAACHATYGTGGILAGDTAVRPTYLACWDIAPLVPTTGTCDGLDAWTCAMHPDCASVFDTTVNPNDSTTETFNHCASEMTPLDPGTCDASQVRCNLAPPACPSGTVPGVANGCWSGYCIPTAQCPSLACDQLTTEPACLARTDCAATYTGMNCTCDANGACTCASETFASCGTR